MMKILCLTIGMVLVAVSAVAQTTPPSSTNRMLTSNNAWLNVNSEPPCAPSTTTGTITLALGSPCANPVYPWLGGSPDNWQFTLTGNGTLATTGPYNPGHVFGIQVTEGPSTAFTLATPTSGWSVQGLCTAAATPSASCGGANGLALSGVASGKNIITCKVIDATPTIWCGPVLAGLTAATVSPTHVQSIAVATASNGGAGTTGTQNTGTFTAASPGNSILCGLTNDAGNNITSMTDSAGNSYTLSANLSAINTNMKYAYALNITGSPTSFTLVLSGSGNIARVYCDAFAGATAIRTAVAPASVGASTTPSQSITGISVGDMLWSQIVPGGVVSSAGAGFTIGVNNQSSQSISTEWSVAVSSGTVPIPWGLASSVASAITSIAIH